MSNAIIIGGTTKAATTSVFNYLKDHPKICASIFKESRFFLEDEYPVALRDIHFNRGNDYGELFKCGDGMHTLEATPDYLYSNYAANKIKETCKKVKLVFILRNPIDRLISWYNFSKQNGDLPENITFKEYVENQSEHSPVQWLRALVQGRYIDYIDEYENLFGKEKILIVLYDDLKDNLTKTMVEIAEFLEIQSDFFLTYQFEIHNKSVQSKSQLLARVYRRLGGLRKFFVHYPVLHRLLKKLKKRTLDPIYNKINSAPVKNEFFPESLIRDLKEYYRDSNDDLFKRLGRTNLWNN